MTFGRNAVRGFVATLLVGPLLWLAIAFATPVNSVRSGPNTATAVCLRFQMALGDGSLTLLDYEAMQSAARETGTGPFPTGRRVPLGKRAFDIDGQLGSGGQGHVYGAIDVQTHLPVAIKTIPRQPDGSIDFDGAWNLRNEFDLLKAVHAAHPNKHNPRFPTVDQYFESIDGGPAFIFEHLGPSGSLKTEQYIGKAHEVASIYGEAALGLEDMHALGFIHRDVKPDNVLRTRTGTKVIDLGLGHDPKKVRDEMFEPEFNPAQGTVYYWSPEVLLEGRVSTTQDLWALAGSIHFSLTGDVPFKGKTLRDIQDKFRELKNTPFRPRESLSPAFQSFFKKAFSFDPKDRYQSAAEMAQALREIAEHTRGR